MSGELSNTDCDVSVVIPLYRSSACVAALLESLTAVLDGLNRSYEIILVDDCSPDDTWEAVRRVIGSYRNVTAIQLMRNRGQAFATLCGLSHTRGKIVITIDDDLQHPPAEIPKLLAVLEGNPNLDVVFGCFLEKKHAAYRNLGSLFVGWMLRKSFNLPRDIRSSAFRAMRQSVVRAVIDYRTANPSLAVLIFTCTSRVQSIVVDHAPRYAGTSNYTLAKQIRLALDNICNVSTFPLRAISVTGMAVCGLSFGLVCFYLLRYAMGGIGVPGWTTVVVLLCFFSGIILLSMGIFGEYMVRILREVRGAPRYVERERIGRSLGGPGHE